MPPKPSTGSAETAGAETAGAETTAVLEMVFAFSNVCWNSAEISDDLKRAANFSSLGSPSEKSMAAQIQELVADFISVSLISAVM